MPKKKTSRELDKDIEDYLSSPSSAPPVGRDPVALVTQVASRLREPERFGPRKVFISAIWERVGDQLGLSLSEFKRWLVEQFRARRIRLERADYVAAMDPDLVRDSETDADGATFHFVVDQEADPSSGPRPDAPREPTRTTRATRTMEATKGTAPTAAAGRSRIGGGKAAPDPTAYVVDHIREIRGAGRFGDRKVFISALYDRVGSALGMSLAEFKAWLIRQHFSRRLVLARADLVAAMDPELVSRSEIDHQGQATYHFVVDPNVR